jgi:hydrogenase expression/formation protein HypE
MKPINKMRDATSQPLASGKLPGELLARLISQYRTPEHASVIVQPKYGFDAAAVLLGDETLLVKSDPITFATEGPARYLVAVNANDIACMGGIPRWLTVVALLPEGKTTPELVEWLFSDLRDACVEAGVALIGGHTEITLGIDRPLLIGTMLGVPGPTGLLHPGEASPGDELYVTKWIGIEGTALLGHDCDRELAGLGEEVLASAKLLLSDPGISIVPDALAALASGVVTALHDPTEGGIATAVHELAGASSLGALVERDSIPVRDETRLICHQLDIDPLGLLSSGALLIAAKPGTGEKLRETLAAASVPVARIGSLTDLAHGIQLVLGDQTMLLPRYDSDEITRVL